MQAYMHTSAQRQTHGAARINTELHMHQKPRQINQRMQRTTYVPSKTHATSINVWLPPYGGLKGPRGFESDPHTLGLVNWMHPKTQPTQVLKTLSPMFGDLPPWSHQPLPLLQLPTRVLLRPSHFAAPPPRTRTYGPKCHCRQQELWRLNFSRATCQSTSTNTHSHKCKGMGACHDLPVGP